MYCAYGLWVVPSREGCCASVSRLLECGHGGKPSYPTLTVRPEECSLQISHDIGSIQIMTIQIPGFDQEFEDAK